MSGEAGDAMGARAERAVDPSGVPSLSGVETGAGATQLGAEPRCAAELGAELHCAAGLQRACARSRLRAHRTVLAREWAETASAARSQ
jgi:hypothetical protein